MRAVQTKAGFSSEADLCKVFINNLPEGWTAYPETCGFDIMLSRAVDGCQIGVEAKKRLTPEVLVQASEDRPYYSKSGPDFRAVLVPDGSAPHPLRSLARRIGITVITAKSDSQKNDERYYKPKSFEPDLPKAGSDWREEWFDCCPRTRGRLPQYVPDVTAGASGPMKLSEWKIKAIKICILLERRGFVTRSDFAALKIDHRRFVDMRWLQISDTRGKYVVGSSPLDLRSAHPRNYVEIEADHPEWSTALYVPDQLTEGELL